MLTHFRTRRVIGAYLDGALDERQARSAAEHLGRCARCRQQADDLRRLRVLLSRAAVAAAATPDWTGFWAGVVRRIEDGQRRSPIDIQWRWPRAVWRPRLAYGGALAGILLVSLTLWQAFYPAGAPQAAVLVRSARTELPGGTVMVYSPPEKDMAVVWVFDEDRGVED